MYAGHPHRTLRVYINPTEDTMPDETQPIYVHPDDHIVVVTYMPGQEFPYGGPTGAGLGGRRVKKYKQPRRSKSRQPRTSKSPRRRRAQSKRRVYVR